MTVKAWCDNDFCIASLMEKVHMCMFMLRYSWWKLWKVLSRIQRMNGLLCSLINFPIVTACELFKHSGSEAPVLLAGTWQIHVTFTKVVPVVVTLLQEVLGMT